MIQSHLEPHRNRRRMTNPHFQIANSNSPGPSECEGPWPVPNYDHNGNIVRYVSESGATVAAYAYDAFGNLLSASGPMADGFAHRFSTKYLDPETGLYYYGYRLYAPDLGRWINRDPVEEGGGYNLYLFCKNNAIVSIDYLGENIYLVEGNNSGHYLNDMYHQSVCVDTWPVHQRGNKPCDKTCYSYAFTGRFRGFPRKFIWLGWFSYTPVGVWMEGQVYDTQFVGTVLRTKRTTKWQDKAWMSYMDHRVGMTDVYSVLNHNCRLFSNLEFDDAPGY